ncbi:TetR/AcrR family transcriptional regulator [Streptomyces luteolus]|uniref:TetR/AcrR family transcriptional regulator n=1 Tax=Streptomyces luteolus TaxID=3043615 RepID=A0ABT6T3R4_9ACTN|nr:TetR/AcrR family transcriptional regulator [Streptomyces sp. B-S-A12]MDI3422512.1 TetR/AcrR family transcriptional regulator [Streptomyces sp. B-S-A12]
MAPRGVAIPDARERLFAAAERVLERDGPGALTSRAVTDEAGCSKGLLHTHFAGLDDFVAELCLDRFARTARQAERLPARAGEGSVARTLGEVALALLRSGGPTISALALSRPAATLRIREALEAGAPGFDAIEGAIASYLDAERRLGRIAPDADTAAAALAVVGAVHHLLMTARPGGTDPSRRVERLVALLVGEAAGPLS